MSSVLEAVIIKLLISWIVEMLGVMQLTRCDTIFDTNIHLNIYSDSFQNTGYVNIRMTASAEAVLGWAEQMVGTQV